MLSRAARLSSLATRSRLARPAQLARVLSTQRGEVICGKTISAAIRSELKESTAELVKDTGVTPGLAVILVGGRTDSATYVRAKKKACAEIGITSIGIDYDTDVAEEEVLAKIKELNEDPLVHGILVQLPLPKTINEEAILHAIAPSKDVDGLHPANVAALCSTQTHGGGTNNWNDMASIDFPIACTPQGCIELLDRSGVEISGKEAVVIGRSNIVGIPAALLLMHRNATVTIVHSRTKDAEKVVGRADIVVAAVGRAEMVKGDWIKPGAAVIDVGINSKEDASKKAGYRLVGDADYESCAAVAGKITPVPGGVGPLTIAILMRNVYAAAKRAAAKA